MLLLISLVVPSLMLLACAVPELARRMPKLLVLAPLPALSASLLASGASLTLPRALLGVTLALDGPGAMLLGVAALLWMAAGFYAPEFLRRSRHGARFTIWWLMTLTGSLGVFMAADLVSFYLTFSLVSLAAYGIIAYDSNAGTRRAGMVYVALAILGEAFLLLAFVMLAAAVPGDSLLISDAVAALPASPWRAATMALLIAGFGVKIGMVPLHGWMPLAYSAAPIPAAAVLSGAAVKAGVIGLIRFLPLGVATPGWGEALTVLGLFSAFYGVAVGITQSNPKTILAYSSISQMGVIAAVFGMGLAAGDSTTATAVAFYAGYHVLAKGALFLAVGAMAAAGSAGRWAVLVPASIVALGLGGLPFTGGALAKSAVKDVLGYGTVGTLAALSAAGTTLLMLHFLRRLTCIGASDDGVAAPGRLTAAWLVMALAAVAVPWLLYPGTLADLMATAALWASVWPILLGGALALALWRWGGYLPQVPPGDIVVFGETAAVSAYRWGAVLERADGFLRQWPVAGVSLLTIVILLAVAMLVPRPG
jgi:formate hydrogenlyase subunit 3/multisubunit Na+/H+ antiporter MnhD subunit